MNRYKIYTVSHSGLNEFEKSPANFISYKEGKHFTNPAMEFGTAIHSYFLEPKKFLQEYMIMDDFAMSIPPKYRIFVDELVRTEDWNVEDEDGWYFNAFVVAEFGREKLETVVEKFNKDTPLIKYYEYVRKSQGKKIINNEQYKVLQNLESSVKSHKLGHLLYDEGIVENKLEWLDSRGFNMVGIIDKYIPMEDTYIITDIKSTSNNIESFITSYEKFRYYRQLAIYRKGLSVKLGVPLDSIRTLIFVMETKNANRCAVLKPSSKDIERGHREAESLLDDLKWHFDNDKWDYTKEYYVGDGSLEISLE